MRVLVVTDPLCSWCWGMAPAVEAAADRLGGEVEFDFLLGGINVHGTHCIGDFGRRHLNRIWRDVHATTGQAFGHQVPDGMVYNSLVPCMAVHAVRRFLAMPPFGYLHRLQQRLFVDGIDTNNVDALAAIAVDFDCPQEVVVDGVKNADIRGAVIAEFESARSYGTNALPSVLVEQGGKRRLLAGGDADADTLVEMIRAAGA